MVDLAHDIPSFSIHAGAYILYSSLRLFKRGTVFLVVVDPGVGSNREPIAVQTRNYFFVGPNNGVLWPVIERDGFVKAVILDNDRFWLKPTSYTFHGRDIFAPAATMLALGVDIESLGSPLSIDRLVQLDIRRVREVDDGYCLDVIHIDKFGNVALSATREDTILENVCVDGHTIICIRNDCIRAKCVKTFSEAKPGELTVYYNSFDFVELAVYMGSAAEKLSITGGDEICMKRPRV